MITGLADVLARIQDIESRFPRVSATGSSSGGNFASLMAAVVNPSDTSTAGNAVVTDASNYLGVPYVLGGTSPATGFDCSGLVQKVYSDLGYQLPRVASDQAKAGTAVASLADALPGDLVAFGTPAHHIGIYVGDGKMIDAPHTGTVVRIENITETPSAIRRIVAAPAIAPSPGFATLAALGLPVSGASTNGSASSSVAGGFGSLFDSATAKYNLPTGLLAAVARAESNYNPNAVSPAGALGMMQLMPSTARAMGVDPLNPAQSVDAAGRILSGGLSEFGSLSSALAAYNAGDSTVRKYGGIPPYPETQAYVNTVLGYLGGTR